MVPKLQWHLKSRVYGMESHLKVMKEITDKLASIGAKVAEEDQVVTLLGSLPSSYSGLVTAVRM